MNESNLFRAESFLNQIGSYLVLDNLFIFFIVPLGVIGFILNVIIFIAVVRLNFITKTVLKSYFIIYTLTSYLVCAISISYAFSRAPRLFFGFTFTYLSAFVRCKFIAFGITLNFFSNILDLFILCERLSNINDKFKKILNLNSYYVCLIVFFLTNIINLPQYYVNIIRDESDFYEAMNNSQILSTFTFCKKDVFFYTLSGNIILYLVTFTRDILTLIVQIIMIAYSIRLFKLYLNQQTNSRIEIIIDCVNQSNASKSVTPPQQNNLQVPDQIINNHQQQTKQEARQRQISGMYSLNSHQKIIIVENFNNKLTKMSILISSMSILSHFGMTFLYLCYGSDSTNNSIWTHHATLLIIFLIQLKYISSFFLFFFYNKNFRIFIYKLFISLGTCIPCVRL
jgi:hypothetical protein